MLKLNQIHPIVIISYILCVISCKSNTTTSVAENTPQNHEIIVVALQTVQDSMQLDQAIFERVSRIMQKYESETKAIQKQQFNNPKSKKQVMQNLMKSRRTELSDVLAPKEMMAFNKLYNESLANERKQARETKQLSEEDRQALSQKLREYRTESVAPILVEQRKALEAAMSPTDKSQIAGLREKITTFNKSVKDKKAACAAIGKAGRKAKAECRRELRALQKTYDPIKKEIDELVALLEEKPGTQTVMTTMDTQRNIWRADLKKILDTYSEKEIDVDKVPLGKYFRMAPTATFLMLNPENITDEATSNDEQ